ncbi:hypothetical protein AX774_g2660 [Zancudomyces culisetae]|uniref:Uncharacterized protein n=1 Tax=Zancudomyces culisetae TaxID=1213189 RepID=A0A1R1PSC8_ZANCU|nr:hypothetical protein AX774_g2660 [Zancudomyces culisetae]|eukprot:OMH83829.1 hypothetical protein AX774_g2660 [Zancudomyces culisetae]
MYGLSNLSVTKAIQELPGANKCTKYIMMNWIDDDKTINGRKSSAGESDIEVEAEAEAEAEEQDASNE